MGLYRQVFLLGAAMIAQPSHATTIDGFGDIKFGMSLPEVIRLGFVCKSDPKKRSISCSAEVNSIEDSNYLLKYPRAFDVPLNDIGVRFDDDEGRVSFIALGFPYEKCDVVHANAAGIFDQMFATKEKDPLQYAKGGNSGWNIGNTTIMISKVSIGNERMSVKFCTLMLARIPEKKQ